MSKEASHTVLKNFPCGFKKGDRGVRQLLYLIWSVVVNQGSENVDGFILGKECPQSDTGNSSVTSIDSINSVDGKYDVNFVGLSVFR